MYVRVSVCLCTWMVVCTCTCMGMCVCVCACVCVCMLHYSLAFFFRFIFCVGFMFASLRGPESFGTVYGTPEMVRGVPRSKAEHEGRGRKAVRVTTAEDE